LTYLGDAELGENVNVGCGSITVNYDGVNKHQTKIESNAFIGCNTNLMAPVTIEEGAFIAAGSTITKDVPKERLAIARAKQEIKDHIGIPLGKTEVSKFSDGETQISIEESVRGCDVYVIQSTSNPVNENLMELYILIDALKRASAATINIVMPYYGYARQDRKARS